MPIPAPGVIPELAYQLAATDDERIMQAEALARAYCGWHIAPSRTETAKVATNGSIALLPSLNVTAVSSVKLHDGTTVDVADYEWTSAGVLTRLGCSWSPRLIEVTFTHGYPEAPREVTAVVQAIAQRGVQNPGSLVRQQVGPFADTYSQTGFNQSLPIALLDAEKEILDRYRIPGRP